MSTSMDIDIEDCVTLTYEEKLQKIILELLQCEEVCQETTINSKIRKLSRKYKIGNIPNHHAILNSFANLNGLVTNSETINKQTLTNFKQFFIPKKVRTESGYFVVTVSLPGSIEEAESCEFDCSFCPDLEKQGFRNSKGEIEFMFMPRSYHDNEPSISRALENGWDPENQVRSRLSTGNSRYEIQKTVIRVIGGTFSQKGGDRTEKIRRKRQYQEWFFCKMFYAANTFFDDPNTRREMLSFDEEKRINSDDPSVVKFVEISVETRPDTLDDQELLRLRRLGVTMVEVGVQTTNDEVNKFNKRGHGVNASKKGIRLLKNAGFKVAIFILLDMPAPEHLRNSMYQVDRDAITEFFNDPDLDGDYYKIYICTNATGTPKLDKWYHSGVWRPYSEIDNCELIIDNVCYAKSIIKRRQRIQRIHRDFSDKKYTKEKIGYESENLRSNFRQFVKDEMAFRGLTCKCIRCREVRSQILDVEKTKIICENFIASGGNEWYFECTDDSDNCYGLLRLRHNFGKPLDPKFFPEFEGGNNWVMIRELHVFGQTINPGSYDSNSNSCQHRGIGKRLVAEAETLARSLNFDFIAVISGVGVREYWKNLGYNLEGNGEYMIKRIA